MDRAYSLLQIKSFDDDTRVLEGIASTPELDRVDDVMDPFGAKYSLPMPFLWQHGKDSFVGQTAVGHVVAATPTASGIPVRVQIARSDEPGHLKDVLDYVWAATKKRLVGGFSIGFNALEAPERMKGGGRLFKRWEWVELSAVTIPANASATITTIKSLRSADLAASGDQDQADISNQSAGVSAPVVLTGRKDARRMRIPEQITALENKRAASEARRLEIQQKASDEGRTKDEDEKTEFQTLSTDLKSIDEELVDLRALETANIASATPVVGTTPKAASESRGSVIQVKSNLAPGTAFTRYVMALAASRGSRLEAMQFAKRWEKSTPEVATVLKAAVDAGTTLDATWAAPLVVYQSMASEFIELLRPQTLIGRIPGFRRVPFNISMPRQTAGSTVNWVGQSAPKPVGELAFDTVSLGMAKVAGIVVINEELARSSNPSAEAIVSQDLRDAIAEYLDAQFIDPSVAAVANVSPASVTNGSSVIDSTGVTAAHLRADFASALAVWTAADMSIAGGVVLMTETQAIRLGMVVNAFGQAEFPGLNATGGTLFGLPVITSENIPAEGGSPAGNRIVLLKPSEILMADDGGVQIDVSREASVHMNTTPDNPASASTVLTNFWQNNLVGIRAERFINWLKRRSAASVIIEGAIYTG